MDGLILKNKKGTYAELLTDFDLSSFKYEYEKNNERSISFSISKTSINQHVFDQLFNEMLLEWQKQLYVIKSTSIKTNGFTVVNDVVAKHIFMEFQNHYIQQEVEQDNDKEKTKPKMNLKEYLEYGFKDNKLGFKFIIKGDFKQRVTIEDIGGKNGLEHLIEGAELFGYIYYADNKTIYIYDENAFYKLSDTPLIHKYNASDTEVSITTTDIKTFIKGLGKKKTKEEIRNYNPIKPPNFEYKGNFIKKGTWRTEEVGASYSKTFHCKWGDETLIWSLKKMDKGGKLDVYIDNDFISSYDCYSKSATTEKITIAKHLKEGKHTFKAVFKGGLKNVDYKKSKPCMYVGTEKSAILNMSANPKGDDIYHVTASYKSPNYDIYGYSEAPTVQVDDITDKKELEDMIKKELNDQPLIEISTNYIGTPEGKQYLSNGDIKENSKVRFINKTLGYNIELKVVKITESHPALNIPVEVDFSNSSKDILKIQQNLNRKFKKVDNLVKGGSLGEAPISMTKKTASDSIGSVLIDE